MLIDGVNLIEGSQTTNLVVTNVTSAQRAVLTNLDMGEIVYQTDGEAGLYIYNGTAWVKYGATATTLSGYGITDAYTKTASDAALALKENTANKGAASGYASLDSNTKIPLAQIPTSIVTQTALDTALALKENTTNKGVASGYASLDSNTKIPLVQIPDSVVGQLEYQGGRDMSAALPAASAANKGYYYITTVNGNGYVTGDWAVSNGVSWDKIDNTDAVQSVAGRTGAVTLSSADISGLAASATTDTTNASNISSGTLAATRLPASPSFSGTVSDANGSVRNLPISTTATTAVLADAGKCIKLTAGITIPASTYAVGDVIVLYNDSAAAVTVTVSSLTAYITGTNATKTSVSLATRGMCSILFYAANSISIAGDVS
jgi:hypothetical protein